ncbi:MAG: Na+/H+ antiporter subunit D [Cyclobacteriaceae bacterium]
MLIYLPLLILLYAAIACLLFWNKPKIQEYLAVSATIGLLGVASLLLKNVYQDGIISSQLGGWSAPYGITLVADTFSALMILISSVTALVCIIYAHDNIDKLRKSKGFYIIFLFMLFGINGAFLAGDIFNLYVWFEVMLVASFVLLSLGSTKAQLEGAVKYVVLNFIASGFFLTGIGLLYRVTGTLNMASLSMVIQEVKSPELVTLCALFFLLSFGIKAAVFPLFFWLPASYHTPPMAITGLMAGLLTKVGVYAIIRFFTLLFVNNTDFTHTLLLIISGLTMVTGVLGAIAQKDTRKLLSFHIISQIGYMIMGLAIFTPLAIAGAIFYIIHNIIVKTNLFLISGITGKINGSFLLKKSGGIYDHYPYLALLFVISAFSLAGIPPLSGFWGKFTLAKAGLENGDMMIVAVSLIVGLLTLFSMTKIWSKVFWPAMPESQVNEQRPPVKFSMILPVVLLAAITLYIGLFPSLLLDIAMQASQQLLNPEEYISVVLNKN